MGKQHIEQAINQVLDRGDKAFIPYIMAGDGGLDQLQDQIDFLSNAGATVIELGIPFSDPVADGPVIQEAGLRALSEGVSLRNVLTELKKFKENRTVPIVLMTYINPIFTYGVDAFVEDCVSSGVDGVIIPDVPLEEESIVSEELSKNDLAHIRLAALTSTPDRLAQIGKRTEGFLYAVTINGTTGVRDGFADELGEHLNQLKQVTDVPVLAGFGVSTPEHVRFFSEHCDGVIVGSRIVDLLHQGKHDEIEKLIQSAKLIGNH